MEHFWCWRWPWYTPVCALVFFLGARSHVCCFVDYRILMAHFHKVIAVYKSLSKGYQAPIKDITRRMGAGMAVCPLFLCFAFCVLLVLLRFYICCSCFSTHETTNRISPNPQAQVQDAQASSNTTCIVTMSLVSLVMVFLLCSPLLVLKVCLVSCLCLRVVVFIHSLLFTQHARNRSGFEKPTAHLKQHGLVFTENQHYS